MAETKTFIATCAAGLEVLVARELQDWGTVADAVGVGSVRWSGDLASGYRACLWSRYASRILLVVAEEEVAELDALYDQTRQLAWEEHFGVGSTFAVDCSLATGAPITHSKFAALRIKDAIVDRFRDRHGERPNVMIQRPDVRVNVWIGNAGSTVFAVDLSGESLHRRGYRLQGGVAPLKESLAAALVTFGGWTGQGPLMDPFCGSATLLIEAALLYGDSAPGLGRSYFGLRGWRGHDEPLWDRLVDEALQREAAGQQKDWPPITGYDADPEAVAGARENIRRAGLEDRIFVHCRELAQLRPDNEMLGWMICNPPYGERLSDKQQVHPLYRCLGNRLRESFSGWNLALFTAVPEYGDLLRIGWRESRRLANGPLSCALFIGSVPPPDEPFQWHIQPIPDGFPGGDLANRLKKNLNQRLKWARSQGITCFRVYDRDLPEYNARIEVYGKVVCIREFRSGKSIVSETADRRRHDIVSVVRVMFGVGRDRLFIKKAGAAIEEAGGSKRRNKTTRLLDVNEQGARYLLDFTTSPDHDLPLDQRFVRRAIGSMAGNRTMLNLADGIGAASVCAALGGARRTTTIVADAGRQERVAQVFAFNGMYPAHHRIVVGDPIHLLKQDGEDYDVIHANLRTAFFRTAGTARRDTRKEHAELIRSAMQRLRPDGALVFSVNLRSFTLDPGLLTEFSCQAQDDGWLPPDCVRSAAVCRYWLIRRS